MSHSRIFHSYGDVTIAGLGQLYNVYNHTFAQMYSLISTGTSGKQCGPWASCCLLNSHTISGTHVYHYRIMCQIHSWPQYGCDLWHLSSITKFIFLPWNFVWVRSFLLFDIGIWNFAHGCITMRQHVYFRDLYDLDLWPICGGGGTLSEFYSVFFKKCTENILINALHYTVMQFLSLKAHLSLCKR